MMTTNDAISNTSRFPKLDTIETNILLWLDDVVHRTNDNLEIQKKLSRIFNDFKVFDDCSACLNYITDIKKQNIILIVADSCAYQIIPIIHDNPHLISIYIFSMMKELNKDFKDEYAKVKDIFTDSNEFLIRLRQDQRICDIISINIYNQSQSESTTIQEQRDSRNASFMFFQIFIDIISNMDNKNSTAKRDLIDHFKRISHGNEKQMALIQEFEQDYHSSKAIYWYTRPTFFFEMLNKALRNSDFDTLLALRFFITDLQKQLISEHENFLSSLTDDDNNPILHVYRGQTISIEEFNLLRESIGEFISFNSFLSTSLNPSVANIFITTAITNANSMPGVFFEFDIDKRVLRTKPYANIKHISFFPDEEEILISLGAIFRIENAKFDHNSQRWIVKLSLCSEDDYELKDLLTKVNTEINNGITSLGWWLYFQGHHQKAKDFFKELLNDSSTIDQFDTVSCIRGIAAVSMALDEYQEAFIYFQQELLFWEMVRDNTEAGKTYIELGRIYFYHRENELALSCLWKAHDLLPSNHHDQSKVYQSMANIYSTLKQFDLAEDYYNRALNVIQPLLPEHHVRFGEIYQSMGRMHSDQKDYERSLKYYSRARQIYIKCRQSNHPMILYLDDRIRMIQELQSDTQVYQNSF